MVPQVRKRIWPTYGALGNFLKAVDTSSGGMALVSEWTGVWCPLGLLHPPRGGVTLEPGHRHRHLPQRPRPLQRRRGHGPIQLPRWGGLLASLTCPLTLVKFGVSDEPLRI